MSDSGKVWQIRKGGKIVAELVVTDSDFPWLNATLRPAPGFEELRPLFEKELRALRHIDEDLGAWDTAYDNIRGAVTLHYPDGRAVPEFLLHIDGQDAWWRWSDEPFDQPAPDA